MKNITNILCMALLSTMSTLTFTACSNDDVDPLTIHGTWMHDDTRDNDYDFISFKSDGSGAKWEVYKNDANMERHDYEEFSYTLEGSKITIIERDGERDIETLKVITNDQIKLDGEVYDRQR